MGEAQNFPLNNLFNSCPNLVGSLTNLAGKSHTNAENTLPIGRVYSVF